ncbi:hypothetical protein [Antrihabitans spumae]|uniref:Thiocillin family RiPP n=1 Tax=Antrihabitans spumae TaxID=3373370 RepID=A0ABW7KIR1_9NOCA
MSVVDSDEGDGVDDSKLVEVELNDLELGADLSATPESGEAIQQRAETFPHTACAATSVCNV